MNRSSIINRIAPYLLISPLISSFIFLLTAKNGMDISVAFCFLSFLLSITFYHKHLKWNKYKTILICYIALGIFYEIWGANSYKSSELRTLIYVAFFILTVPTHFLNKKLIKNLVILSSLLLLLQAIYQHHYLGIARVGSHINPVQYATVCATLSLLLFVFILDETNKTYQKILTLLFILSLITIIYTGSRGPWIAVLGGFLLISFLGFKHFKKSLRLSTLLLGFFGVLLVLSSGYTVIKKRINQVQKDYHSYQQHNYDTSAGARLHLYKTAIYTITRDNFMGLKVSYKENLNDLSNKGVYQAKAKYGHFHNSYLDRLAKFGLIGLLLFLAFTLYPFLTTLRDRHNNYIFFLLALSPPCVYLLSGLFAVSFRSEESLFFFVIVNYLPFLINQDLPKDQLMRNDILNGTNSSL